MSKLEVVFILGLRHTGSTVMDMMLGTHPRLVGVGESHRSLRAPDKGQCSCGEPAQNCPFWTAVSAELSKSPNRSSQDDFVTLYRVFQNSYGKGTILVDSSKRLGVLQTVAGMPNIQLRVLYLMRDVRSWSIAMQDRAKARLFRPNKRTKLDRLKLHAISASSFTTYFEWYRENKKFMKLLKELDLETLQVSYEELAIYPEEVLAKICDFIGVERFEEARFIHNSSSHIIQGNNMRSDASKRQAIKFDNRVLYRNDSLLPSVMLPHIMRFNSREVYRNLRYGMGDSTNNWQNVWRTPSES